MEFRLVYRGPLKSGTSATKIHKQVIRRAFQPQLRSLWDQKALEPFRKYVDPSRSLRDGDIWLIQRVGPFAFAPLISQAGGWNAVCEIDILFLRPAEPGQLLSHGGDLDNRIKTLFDALRVPTASELPDGDMPNESERPFHCLLQDDALVTRLGVTTDRLLVPTSGNDVELILTVKAKATRKSMGNDPIW